MWVPEAHSCVESVSLRGRSMANMLFLHKPTNTESHGSRLIISQVATLINTDACLSYESYVLYKWLNPSVVYTVNPPIENPVLHIVYAFEHFNFVRGFSIAIKRRPNIKGQSRRVDRTTTQDTDCPDRRLIEKLSVTYKCRMNRNAAGVQLFLKQHCDCS